MPVRWLGSARPGSRLTSSRRAALAHKGSSSSCCVVRAVRLAGNSEDSASASSSLLPPRFFDMLFLSFCCVIRAHAYATRRDITCGVVRTGPSDRHGRTTESGADGVSVSLEAALPKHDHGASQRRPARRSQPVAGALPAPPLVLCLLSSVVARPRLAPCHVDFFLCGFSPAASSS